MSDPIRSVQSFLQTVWREPKPEGIHIHLYRGQAKDKEWPLLPKLFRKPNTVQQVEEREKDLLHRFKNESPYLLPSRPTNDWDWLSLGQHFKLPTRLLDWTANPLTALFFAVGSGDPEQPIVHIYHATKSQIVKDEDKRKVSPFDIQISWILQPSWHSIRVAMQAGWHTVHRVHQSKGHRSFVPLTDMSYHGQHMSKIVIDPKSSGKIRTELADMGIKHSTVYGDLESVCASIQSGLGFT
jgi:hypothetical protein